MPLYFFNLTFLLFTAFMHILFLFWFIWVYHYYIVYNLSCGQLRDDVDHCFAFVFLNIGILGGYCISRPYFGLLPFWLKWLDFSLVQEMFDFLVVKKFHFKQLMIHIGAVTIFNTDVKWTQLYIHSKILCLIEHVAVKCTRLILLVNLYSILLLNRMLYLQILLIYYSNHPTINFDHGSF